MDQRAQHPVDPGGGNSPPLRVMARWSRWWTSLVEGDLAGLAPEQRRRMVAWQERRTRLAMLGVFRLFVFLGMAKTLLVAVEAWQVASPAWAYLALTMAMGLAAHGYGRARGTLGEALCAIPFLIALMLLVADPLQVLRGDLEGGAGLLLLLPAIGIPLLVLLRSAIVLALFCILASAWFLWSSHWDAGSTLGFALNMAVAIAGGMMIRVYRANMSVAVVRSMDAAIQQATTDSLTGLLNRQGWFQAAEKLVGELRGGHEPATLLFMDLDDFKKLNDRLGHAAGDEALRRTGRVLLARMNRGALAARIGGEEFVCLLPGQNAAQARRLAKRVSDDLKAGPLPVSFSAGVAERQPGDTLGDWMKRADLAMYGAKARGRDRIVEAPAAPPAESGREQD